MRMDQKDIEWSIYRDGLGSEQIRLIKGNLQNVFLGFSFFFFFFFLFILNTIKYNLWPKIY